MFDKWCFPLKIFVIFDKIGYQDLFDGTKSWHAVH